MTTKPFYFRRFFLFSREKVTSYCQNMKTASINISPSSRDKRLEHSWTSTPFGQEYIHIYNQSSQFLQVQNGCFHLK